MTKEEWNSNPGRPSKLPKFIEAAKELLLEQTEKQVQDATGTHTIPFNLAVVALKEEELLQRINDKLDEEDRVAKSTYENWKAGNIKDPVCQQFLEIYKKALAIQREAVMSLMIVDEGKWQRFAWIIERKFDEWKLKTENRNINENKSEVLHKADENLSQALLGNITFNE